MSQGKGDSSRCLPRNPKEEVDARRTEAYIRWNTRLDKQIDWWLEVQIQPLMQESTSILLQMGYLIVNTSTKAEEVRSRIALGTMHQYEMQRLKQVPVEGSGNLNSHSDWHGRCKLVFHVGALFNE